MKPEANPKNCFVSAACRHFPPLHGAGISSLPQVTYIVDPQDSLVGLELQ
jgi:hypothetical protein